jgi:hypothetical protein
MNDEFSALMKNETWILVPRQSHMNIIVCKYIFYIKKHVDVTFKCYKAHLMAKDFHQQQEIDYNDISSVGVETNESKQWSGPLQLLDN